MVRRRSLVSQKTNSRIVLLLAMIIVAPVLGVVALVSPAGATPTKPTTDESYYVNSSSTTSSYNAGCTQGSSDASTGSNSMAWLDFGGQTSSGSQTAFGGGILLSYAQIENIGLAYAQGYYACTGSDTTTRVTLVIGTNNSINNGSTYGTTWGNVVSTTYALVHNAGYASQVLVWGGDDMEPGFGSQSSTQSWATSFSGTGNEYLDYGSADGCQLTGGANGTCNNGWTIAGEYDLAYGQVSAQSDPEIVSTATANEWANISEYGKLNGSSGLIYFEGPIDEYPRGAGWNASSAWSGFYSALTSYGVAMTPTYSLETSASYA
jgi:hypothetical protein